MSAFVDYTLTQDVANGSSSTGSTTMAIAYPSGVTAGQLLIVWTMWTRTAGGGPFTATLSGSGWSTDGPVGFAATYAVQAWYKIAAGTETGSETLSHSSASNRHFHDAFMLRYDINEGLDMTGYLLDTDLASTTSDRSITLDEDGIGFDMDEALSRLVIGLHFFTHPDAFPFTAIGPPTNSTLRFDVADSATGTATAYRYVASDHIYAPGEAALDIVTLEDQAVGTSGSNNISMFLGFEFTDEAVATANVGSIELPPTRLYVKGFPNRLTHASLDGFD